MQELKNTISVWLGHPHLFLPVLSCAAFDPAVGNTHPRMQHTFLNQIEVAQLVVTAIFEI